MSSLDGKFMEINVDEIQPNPWNPNQMNDEMFNRLADEIEEVGFINPIQVVPMDDGSYRIIGGEHRWRVGKVLGLEEIPCIVLDGPRWKEEDLQKFVTTRLNAISGKLNPERFMELYNDLSTRHDHDALQLLMGYTDSDIFAKMTRQARAGLESAGVSDDKLKEFDEVAKEIKTVDDLSNIINKIFNSHGDQLEHNFMYFGYGGEEHLYIHTSRTQFSMVKLLMKHVEDNGLDAAELIASFAKTQIQAG